MESIIRKKNAAALSRSIKDIIPRLNKDYCEVWGQEYPPPYLIKNAKESETEKFGSDELRKAIGKPDSFALYIHFPFCESRCDYCTYYAGGNPGKETFNKYFSALKKEFDLRFKSSDGVNKKKITCLYLGGGTPTLAGRKNLENLFSFLRKRTSIDDGTEITIETTPGLVDSLTAQTIRRCGINRVSIGVQTFNGNILRSVGRKQKNAEVYAAVSKLRQKGIKNINLDFIFGLSSKETSASFLRDNLSHINFLRPESVYLYYLQNYAKHPDSIFKSGDQTGILRSGIEKHNKYTNIFDMGIIYKPKKRGACQNRKKYANQYTMFRRVYLSPVMGLGFGATTHIWREGQYSNCYVDSMNIERYMEEAQRGTLSFRCFSLSRDESVRKYVIQRLYYGLDLSLIRRLPGISRTDVEALILPLIGSYVERDKELIYLKKGFERHLPVRINNPVVNYFIFSFVYLYSLDMQKRFLNHYV